MLVKCRHCEGKRIDRDTAFVVRKGNKNLYYCNEAEWLSLQNAKESRQKCKDDIQSILDWLLGAPTINTALYKEWQQWNKVATNEELLRFLCDNKKTIAYRMQRDFDNEYQSIRYLSAIIKNMLRDYMMKPQVVNTEKDREVEFEMFTPVVRTGRRKKGLAEMEDDMGAGVD